MKLATLFILVLSACAVSACGVLNIHDKSIQNTTVPVYQKKF